MKKVWILEKFQTSKAMITFLADYEQMLEEAKKVNNEEAIKGFETVIIKHKKAIEENPTGRWVGWEGKSVYSQFCNCAKDALRRADKSWKFRVIEAEISNDATSWLGYKFVKENEGVLRYLMATK